MQFMHYHICWIINAGCNCVFPLLLNCLYNRLPLIVVMFLAKPLMLRFQCIISFTTQHREIIKRMTKLTSKPYTQCMLRVCNTLIAVSRFGFALVLSRAWAKFMWWNPICTWLINCVWALIAVNLLAMFQQMMKQRKKVSL